jgi:hypothetical protein
MSSSLREVRQGGGDLGGSAIDITTAQDEGLGGLPAPGVCDARTVSTAHLVGTSVRPPRPVGSPHGRKRCALRALGGGVARAVVVPR